MAFRDDQRDSNISLATIPALGIKDDAYRKKH
jgi:hypothetical protein